MHAPAGMTWCGQTQREFPQHAWPGWAVMLKGWLLWVFLGGVVVALKYVIIGIVAIAAVVAATLTLLPPTHRASMQYVGSPSGYEAFVPSGTISYKETDPEGDLILPNGTTLTNVIWNGQYASTINQNHNQIDQLNNQFVGQTDPVNNQQYVNLQDVYVVKGQVPVQQVTINGQPYYVIEADKINPANIAGFYTYDKWIPNFVAAMNTPGTYAAGLPGNSPVFQWTNTTGTVAYQTIKYEQYGPDFTGRHIVELFNKTIIPYGTIYMPGGAAFTNFIVPQQVYNPSS